MTFALELLAVMLSPFVIFGLLMWLAHLEETLPRAVDASRRKAAPAPILLMQVRGAEAVAPVVPAIPAPVVTVPEQRPAPAIEVVPAQRDASAVLSLGGSTNR
jgi:hypothetical protein